jgi:hypothetical protein
MGGKESAEIYKILLSSTKEEAVKKIEERANNERIRKLSLSSIYA